jgi:L-iditol 2-dehydrogenase
MKVLVYTGPLRLEYTDLPDPVPDPGEIPVRVKAVAICGSDVHGYTGSTGRRVADAGSRDARP